MSANEKELLDELTAAREGVQEEKRQAAGLPPDDDTVTHIKPLASTDDFVRRFVHVADCDSVFDLEAVNPGNAIMARTKFESAYAHSRTEVKGPKGGISHVVLPKAWLTREDRLSVYGVNYNPLEQRRMYNDFGRAWVNSFWMPRWERRRVKKLEKLFLDHMVLLVPDAKEREVVLDWFAHLVQRPGVRQRFALMMVAAQQGTGRGWVVEMLKRVLGSQNVKPFSMKEFDSDFDDAFIDCILNVVEEVRESTEGKYTLGEKLKDRITMQSTVANIKYGAKKLTRIYASLLMQSNHPDAIVIRDEDRRVMVVATNALPRPDAYYAEMYGRLDEPEFVGAVAAYLLERDLTEFRATLRAPMTPAKQAMISASVSEVDDGIATFLEDCREPYFTSKQVERYFGVLQNEGAGIDTPSDKVIGAVLLRVTERVTGLPDNAVKHKGIKVRPWQRRGEKPSKPSRGDLRPTVRRSLESVDSWLNARAFAAVQKRRQ